VLTAAKAIRYGSERIQTCHDDRVRDRPRDLLYVLGNGGRGGMQSQARLVAAGLAARGHRVTLAVGGGDAPLAGVDVRELPELAPRRPLPFARALRSLAREFRPEVLHGHGLRLAPLAAVSGVRTRVVTCHGLDPERAAATVRLVRHLPVSFVSCGEGPRRLLARHGLASRVVNNAFEPAGARRDPDELRRAFALSAHVALVVLPARFSAQKNHRGLLEALELVRGQLGAQSPEVLCLGEGPLASEVAARAVVPGDRPLLRCHPYLPDAAAWLSAADFFVLPSRWEGQPLVVLEALAAGLAVATTTPVGVEDLVLDARNGRRVATTAELAEVMVDWVRHPEHRPRDPALTATILAEHRLDVVLDAHEDLYRELL
jgi:glycosyltransferase involved in cell wall biosynthesis